MLIARDADEELLVTVYLPVVDAIVLGLPLVGVNTQDTNDGAGSPKNVQSKEYDAVPTTTEAGLSPWMDTTGTPIKNITVIKAIDCKAAT